MKYEILNRNDFITGAYLVIRIPENELDQCALSTIQADRPDFIIPFHYKRTDGHIEFTYKVGTLCKLHYFSGDLTPKEYADLWQCLLKPLLDCTDWFMNPCSFVLNADYLYFDKINKSVSYVYVPTAYGCSGYDAFYEMAVEVSKMMTVSDAVLENKVLKAIMKDFNPVEFLQMLKDHADGYNDVPQVLQLQQYNAFSTDKIEENPIEKIEEQSTLNVENNLNDSFDISDLSIIDFDNKKERGSGGYKIFGRRSKRKKALVNQRRLPESSAQHILPGKVTVNAEYSPAESHHIGFMEGNQAEVIDITQNTTIISGGPGLRYVGRSQLPPAIHIMISEGEIFTIGRFDATIGKKQSNFEFDKKTKAVSRRHAVIERDIEGYKIVDLSSSAGTFVNDKKLPPNTPHGLETGCRVSFGNSGADYVWEVS